MVSDSRAPRDGRHIDSIGYYNPLTSPKDIKIEKEKALDWLNRGAIPSPTVRSLLSGQGILLEWELQTEQIRRDYRRRVAKVCFSSRPETKK